MPGCMKSPSHVPTRLSCLSIHNPVEHCHFQLIPPFFLQPSISQQLVHSYSHTTPRGTCFHVVYCPNFNMHHEPLNIFFKDDFSFRSHQFIMLYTNVNRTRGCNFSGSLVDVFYFSMDRAIHVYSTLVEEGESPWCWHSNEGCFTSIIIVSYLTSIYKARPWDECYCLQLEVIPLVYPCWLIMSCEECIFNCYFRYVRYPFLYAHGFVILFCSIYPIEIFILLQVNNVCFFVTMLELLGVKYDLSWRNLIDNILQTRNHLSPYTIHDLVRCWGEAFS